MTGRVAIFARGRVAARPLALAGAASLLLTLVLVVGLRALERGVSAAPGARGSATGALARLSPEARASLSASVGASDPAYHFQPADGGFQAANRSQHLRVLAAPGGVTLQLGGLRLGIGLHGVRYGNTLLPTHGARLTREANRATYSSAGVQAWYVNGPFGVEQGFTLAQPAGHVQAGSVALAMTLSGNARAVLAEHGQSVEFSAAGRTLRYGDLRVRDATGRLLTSRITLSPGGLLLRVDTRGARFPLHVDPFTVNPDVEIAERVLKQNGAPGERAGLSVALSANGTTAVVGAPDGEEEGGSVWVFTRGEGEREFKEGEQLLVPGSASGTGSPESGHCDEADEAIEEGDECGFGRSVAISADGQELLVGAPLQAEESAEGAGAAWVFTRSAEGWQGTELVSPKPVSGGHFGRSVSLSANGETALIGAPGERFEQGHAWIFELSGSEWKAQGTPFEGGGAVRELEHFGESVALSANGEVALVGAPASSRFIGAAWAFERDDPASPEWHRNERPLVGENELGAGHFGYSVALSENGSTALVGAPLAEGVKGAPRAGQAWVFERSPGSTEYEVQATITRELEKAEFGYSVALLGNGDGAVIGAPFFRDLRGTAYLFGREGSSWSELKQLQGGSADRSLGRFGKSVATTPEGAVQLVGAPGEREAEGRSFVFGDGPVINDLEPKNGPKSGGTDVTISGQHLAGATEVTFGTTPAASFKVHVVGELEWITAVSPAGSGTVNIQVRTPFGLSEAKGADQFTYKGEEGGSTGKREGTNPPPPPPPPPPTGGTPGETPLGTNTDSPSTVQGSVQVLAAGPIVKASCGVALMSSRLAVQARGHAALLRLRSTGTASCRGHVTLSVKVKSGKGRHARTKTKQIGTANFVIAAGRTELLKVKLNAFGRALLAADHGRLKASLLIIRSTPSPRIARTSNVRLARRPAGKRKHKP
jgi:hypothetical protein